MSPQLIVLLLLVSMTLLFIQGRYRYDMIALAGLLVLAVTGVLPAPPNTKFPTERTGTGAR